MSNLRLFTSESVTEGHPDKLCDQVSDRILDAMLTEDPSSRVAVETLVTNGLVQIAGEVSTAAPVDIPAIAREAIARVGYTSSEVGFDASSCGVNVAIGRQAPEIAAGVNESLEVREGAPDRARDAHESLGAGDQGLMFGFASDETDTAMPMPIWVAHRLAERLAQVRHTGELDYLRPDGKTQATIGYDGATPVTANTIVVSTQHDPGVELATVRSDIAKHVIMPVLETTSLDTSDVRFLVNPSGSFIDGGPRADAGLTGRKIIVDTYGGFSRHGGGAFSGKDPSKVDRSGAYAMRWVAKNVVAAGLAKRLEVQVAYAIGSAEPVGLYVETFGTAEVDPADIERAIRDVFDLRPAAIIEALDLKRPIYAATATYGHFGRELPDFTWERTDRVDDLRAAIR